MQDYTNNEDRASLIDVINSPLGFFALSLLIVEGFLGIVLIFSGLENNAKFTGMIIGAAIFTLVLIIVSLLVAYKPKNLIFRQEGHLIESGFIINKDVAENASTSNLAQGLFNE